MCFIILGFTPSSDVLLRKEELNCLTGAGDQKGGGPHGGDQLGDQDGGDQYGLDQEGGDHLGDQVGGDQHGGRQVGGDQEGRDQVGTLHFYPPGVDLFLLSGLFLPCWIIMSGPFFAEWTLFTFDFLLSGPFLPSRIIMRPHRCQLITDTIDPPLDCRLKREKVPALI